MENHKLKKLTSWLLYNVGAQPTEPRAGALNLAEPLDPKEVAAKSAAWQQIIRRFRWPLVITGVLIVLAGIWWAVGPLLARAQVGSQTVRLGGSSAALTATLTKAVNEYTLPVQYSDGKTQAYALKDVGFELNAPETIHQIRAVQNSFSQRFMWWRTIEQPLALKSNPKKLHAFIANHITASVQPSQDATLIIEDGEVAVVDAVTGKQYGLDNPQMTLFNHTARLDAKPVKISLLTINPAVTSQELAASKTRLEQVLNQPISFTVDKKMITPAKKDIATWLELTPNTKTGQVDIDINSGKVLEYINKLAAANVHPARDQVVVTHDDGTKSVVVAGVNGVDITDKQGIATTVTNNLLAGKGIQANLPVSFKAYDTISTAAYSKWIEVDLANKRMHAYEKTSLVRTFLVSAGAPKTPTVKGKFAIYSKYTQKDMRGNNVDGSKYFQPNVPWVSFFYKDYAIHGNYWRPTSYFGNINSSHGCVSTVPNEAAWMYDWAPIGTPVIVHD